MRYKSVFRGRLKKAKTILKALFISHIITVWTLNIWAVRTCWL